MPLALAGEFFITSTTREASNTWEHTQYAEFHALPPKPTLQEEPQVTHRHNKVEKLCFKHTATLTGEQSWTGRIL